MADKKVSQETDLGLAGIDGTVEYRVIKSGGTYRQKYSDLFSYINSHSSIPTLQQVLDNNHDLLNGIVKIGTLAGDGSSSAVNLISIGNGALQNSSGPAGTIGIGPQAGLSSSIGKGVIIGFQTGNGASGLNTVILGNSAGFNAIEGDSIILGYNAGYRTCGTGNTYIGEGAGNYSGYGLLAPGVLHNVFIGHDAGGTASTAGNLGNYNIAIGEEALYNNDNPNRSNIVALGNQAGYSVGHSIGDALNSVYIGNQAGYNASGGSMVALGNGACAGSQSEYLIGLGDSAAAGSTSSYTIGIGGNAASNTSGNRIIAIGQDVATNFNKNDVIGIGVGALTSMQNDSLGNVIAIGSFALSGINADPADTNNYTLIGIGQSAAINSVAINRSIIIGNHAGEGCNNNGLGGSDSNNVVIGHDAYQGLSDTIGLVAVGNDILNTVSGVLYNSTVIGTGAMNSGNISGSKTSIIAIGANAGNNSDISESSIFIGNSAGNQSTGGDIIAIGENALVAGTASSVVGIGLGVGDSNPVSNSFIIANRYLPEYPDHADAESNIISAGGVSGNTYLYYNSTTHAIEGVRL